MGGFLIHEPAHVAVGRLHHGVELVCRAPVHLPAFYPGQQHRDGLRELAVIWNGGRRQERATSSRVLLRAREASPGSTCSDLGKLAFLGKAPALHGLSFPLIPLVPQSHLALLTRLPLRERGCPGLP